MASAHDVIAAIEKFELDLIEKQWSDDIWANEFKTYPDGISEEFADRFSLLSYCDIVQVIEQADKVINLWLENWLDKSHSYYVGSSNKSTIGPTWTLLQEVDYKKLLSLLYFYIHKGHMNNQDLTAVHTCIKATNFYFTLLTIPGSDIYKIFNVVLFEKCLETFTLHKFLEIATGRMIKRANPQRKSEEFSSDDEEYLEMDETLTLCQQKCVVKQLNFLLSTFKQFVNKFSFKKYPEALNASLSILSELSRIERNSSLEEFFTSNVNTSLALLSRNAYFVMKDFCSAFHGRVPEIIRLVLFYLMPNLTSIGGLTYPEFNKLNARELTNIRTIAISFIIKSIIPLGEDAYLGLKILIQQLCFNMIDRADYRSKATDMVVAILCKLPMNLYYSLLKWIFRLSVTEGAHHRVLSLELLSKLIFMKPESEDLSKLTDSQYGDLDSELQNSRYFTRRSKLHQKSNSNSTSSLSQEKIVSFSKPLDYIPLEFRRVMFAIIVDRIRDEASTVRTRALSILAEIISNRTSKALQVILRDIFVNPYADCDEISLEPPVQEADFLKWKAFVTLIEKAHEAEVPKSMFPGGRTIVNKVFEKCLDERVNVRKASLQVISSLFKLSSKWMTSKSLQLFGKHCRDPALSIRKEMLNSVTELMKFFTGHEAVIELWVEEVVPLIMDREIRVQEQALQIFSETILSKITSFNKMQSPLDELPWKLLDKIAKQNKRCFLMTACSLWDECKSFSQSFITNLQSHIGTVNDAPAWIFLASLSEYFVIENPEFVMTYYMDTISKEIGNKNSSYLALLTLSTSWQKLPDAQKEILQAEMCRKLKSFSVSPTFVGLTVEIYTGITVMTAEDELSGKKEVAKWAIEMIQICEAHLIDCFKTPATSECKHCINVLALFGVLIGICPDKIRQPTFLMLFNYLMNSKNGGSSFYRKKKAITVITLSKMALQSDHLARNLVSGLAQLLDNSTDPVVLNNVIVGIADIGESYANLIEPLIPFICVCMKSKCSSLTEITLILLIELLQEDYLKARGALVFHLLTMINDPNPWLGNTVKFYFINSLLARNPYKMNQLLLPGIFHFNNYTNHPDYPKLDMADAEARAFDLSGPENHSKRMNIYQFMLSNIPDMVKMKCLHFICTVILNGAADDIINIKSDSGEQLLLDALSILVTPEIKIEYSDLVKKKNEDGEEDDNQKQHPLYKLGKQVFTTAQKKEIIETIIPICCKLKKKLLMENKKLLPHLHKFVRELVKDYKSEMNEIFKEDKQFGIEILHELDKIPSIEEEELEDEGQLRVVGLSESQNAGETTNMTPHLTTPRKERDTSKRKEIMLTTPEESFQNAKRTCKANVNAGMQEQGKQPSPNSQTQSENSFLKKTPVNKTNPKSRFQEKESVNKSQVEKRKPCNTTPQNQKKKSGDKSLVEKCKPCNTTPQNQKKKSGDKSLVEKCKPCNTTQQNQKKKSGDKRQLEKCKPCNTTPQNQKKKSGDKSLVKKSKPCNTTPQNQKKKSGDKSLVEKSKPCNTTPQNQKKKSGDKSLVEKSKPCNTTPQNQKKKSGDKSLMEKFKPCNTTPQNQKKKSGDKSLVKKSKPCNTTPQNQKKKSGDKSLVEKSKPCNTTPQNQKKKSEDKRQLEKCNPCNTTPQEQEKLRPQKAKRRSENVSPLKFPGLKILSVSVEDICRSKKYLKLSEKTQIKVNVSAEMKLKEKLIMKNQRKEKRMQKARHDIIMPPPTRTSPRNKKRSLTESTFNESPKTPLAKIKKKELLTSTPLVTLKKNGFDADISAVVNER